MSDVPTYPIAVIAKLCDCTERHIRRLAAEGHITKPGGRKKWPVTTVTEYIRYLRDKAYQKSGSDGGDYHGERTRLARAQADRQEMENELRRNELIETDKVLDAVGNEIQNAKAKLLAIPASIAAFCEHKSAAEVEKLIHDGIHEALADLGGAAAELETASEVHDLTVG